MAPVTWAFSRLAQVQPSLDHEAEAGNAWPPVPITSAQHCSSVQAFPFEMYLRILLLYMILRAAITIHQHCHSDQKPPPTKHPNNSTRLSVTPLTLLFPTQVSPGYPRGTLGASCGDSHMGTCTVLAPQVFPFPQALSVLGDRQLRLQHVALLSGRYGLC